MLAHQDSLEPVTLTLEDVLISTNALEFLHAILWSPVSTLSEVSIAPTAQLDTMEVDTPIALSTALLHV